MFAGTVLPPTGQGLIDADAHSSFHVADREKAAMARSLRGLPVRFEHNAALQVGTVRDATVQPNGSVRVIGTLSHPSLTADFVRNCVDKQHYRGLSLCHAWTRDAEGRENKRPIEVSVCSSPRRPGCHIELIASGYKRRRGSEGETMSSEHAASQKETSAPSAAEAPAPTDPAPEGAAPPESEPAIEDEATLAMKTALDERAKFEEEKLKREALQKKLDEIERAQKEAEAQASRELEDKSKILAQSLRDNWSSWAPQNASFDDANKLFDTVRKHDPKLGHELLQLVECASKKTVTAQNQLAEVRADSTRQAVKAEYQQKVLQRGSAAAAAAPAPPASAAPAPPTTNPYAMTTPQQSSCASSAAGPYNSQAKQIREAFNGMAGGALFNMQRLVEASRKKRPRLNNF